MMQSIQRRPISRSSTSRRKVDVPRCFLSSRDCPIRRSVTGRTRLYVRAVSEPSGVDSAIDSVVDILKLSGEFLKSLIELETEAEKFLNANLPAVTEVIRKVTPVVKRVTQSAVDITSSAVTPAVKSAVQAARDALTEQGVDVTEVQSKATSAVQTASDAATPAVKSSVTFLTATDPIILGYYALSALGLYFFGPPLFAFVIGVTRGYAGDITPAGALDVVLSKRDAYLIDIRTVMEKERSGVIDVPGGAIGGRFIELEFAMTKDKKLRGQLRDPESVECRITALQIAALKRLRRGCLVYLLDTNGGLSKRVARELQRLGFDRCFVVNGGYSAWVRAKLQTKPSSTVYSAEVIQPSTIFGGTIERRISVSNQKSLPPGKQQ